MVNFSDQVIACPIGDYTIETQTGQQIVPGTTDIGNSCDDCTTSILPFPVQLYDGTFNTANVSSNGNLQFDSNSSAFVNACCRLRRWAIRSPRTGTTW